MEKEYEGKGPFRYHNGGQPHIGDIVRLDGFHRGVVVGVMDTGEFLDEKYKSFEYLGGGILILDDEIGLIAILDDQKEVYLVKSTDEPEKTNF
jgi:hypothetical protein